MNEPERERENEEKEVHIEYVLCKVVYCMQIITNTYDGRRISSKIVLVVGDS